MSLAAPIISPAERLPCPIEADTNDEAGRDGRKKRPYCLPEFAAFHDFAVLTRGDADARRKN